MADVKISQLPAATTPLDGTELTPIVQSGTTKRVSVANLTVGRALTASSLTLSTPLSAANGGTGLTSLGTGIATFLGTPTSANLAAAVTDETGTGALVFGTSPTIATPTLSTSFTSPLHIGGTTASSTLTLQSTSGVGTSDSIVFKVGNNGATTAATFDTSGNLGVGATSLNARLQFANEAASTAGTSNKVLLYYGSSTAAFGLGIASGQMTYNCGDGAHVFYTGGNASPTERARIDASGNLLVGTSTNYGKISAYTTTDLDTISCAGSANNIGFSIQNAKSGAVATWNMFSTATGSGFGAGLLAFARGVSTPALYMTSADLIYAPATYNSTTATAANMVINSDGLIQRSTSSRRYKTNIVNAVHGLSDLQKLRAVTYNGINDGDKVFGGLIAEEVDAAGLTEFVAYDDEGKPDALHYGNMAGLFVKAIQELAAKVSALEAKQ